MIYPPTPTLLPPGAPPVSFPESYSLWASAPYAIQLWNLGGDGKVIFQAIIVLAILIAIGYTAVKAKNSVENRRQGETQ